MPALVTAFLPLPAVALFLMGECAQDYLMKSLEPRGGEMSFFTPPNEADSSGALRDNYIRRGRSHADQNRKPMQ